MTENRNTVAICCPASAAVMRSSSGDKSCSVPISAAPNATPLRTCRAYSANGVIRLCFERAAAMDCPTIPLAAPPTRPPAADRPAFVSVLYTDVPRSFQSCCPAAWVPDFMPKVSPDRSAPAATRFAAVPLASPLPTPPVSCDIASI